MVATIARLYFLSIMSTCYFLSKSTSHRHNLMPKFGKQILLGKTSPWVPPPHRLIFLPPSVLFIDGRSDREVLTEAPPQQIFFPKFASCVARELSVRKHVFQTNPLHTSNQSLYFHFSLVSLGTLHLLSLLSSSPSETSVAYSMMLSTATTYSSFLPFCTIWYYHMKGTILNVLMNITWLEYILQLLKTRMPYCFKDNRGTRTRSGNITISPH